MVKPNYSAAHTLIVSTVDPKLRLVFILLPNSLFRCSMGWKLKFHRAFIKMIRFQYGLVGCNWWPKQMYSIFPHLIRMLLAFSLGHNFFCHCCYLWSLMCFALSFYMRKKNDHTFRIEFDASNVQTHSHTLPPHTYVAFRSLQMSYTSQPSYGVCWPTMEKNQQTDVLAPHKKTQSESWMVVYSYRHTYAKYPSSVIYHYLFSEVRNLINMDCIFIFFNSWCPSLYAMVLSIFLCVWINSRHKNPHSLCICFFSAPISLFVNVNALSHQKFHLFIRACLRICLLLIVMMVLYA